MPLTHPPDVCIANWTDYWTGSGDHSHPGFNSCYHFCIHYEMEEETGL